MGRFRTFQGAVLLSILLHVFLFFSLWLEQTRWWEFLWNSEEEPQSYVIPVEDEARVVFNEAGEQTEDAVESKYQSARNQRVQEETVAQERDLTEKVMPAQPSSLQKFAVDLPNVPSEFAEAPAKPEWVPYRPQQEKVYQDYVKGLKAGEVTALNTREFIFHAYYQRINQLLSQAWPKKIQEKVLKLIRRGDRLPASDKEHLTQTRLTLDSRGEVISVEVLRESGTEALDEAAVEAFNEAGPFPNPPQAIIGENGLIEITWSFLINP